MKQNQTLLVADSLPNTTSLVFSTSQFTECWRKQSSASSEALSILFSLPLNSNMLFIPAFRNKRILLTSSQECSLFLNSMAHGKVSSPFISRLPISFIRLFPGEHLCFIKKSAATSVTLRFLPLSVQAYMV